MLRTSVLNSIRGARLYAYMRTCGVGVAVLSVGRWRGGFGCWALAWRFGCWTLCGVSAVVGVVVGLNDGAQSISLALSIPSPVTRADATRRYI